MDPRILTLASVALITNAQTVPWPVLNNQTCLENTCRQGDSECECFFTIEHRLTMMLEDERTLLVPIRGAVYRYNDYNRIVTDPDVLTLDGYQSRLVISINRQFPGPEIKAYEGQTMKIHVHNAMHTDSTSIHFHGIHQRNSAWADGVAFITQCPILPGQYYTYSFNLSQHGTYLYHSHIGDQRSMGLYGSFIVYPKVKSEDIPDHTVLLQDWNHDDDSETLYQKMLFGTFDLSRNTEIKTTKSVDNSNFSRFVFHSGLINGKGRYYTDSRNNNGAPLTVYNVERNKEYRFRVISAATLYPFRVFVQGHRTLKVIATDGFDVTPIEVESFVIQPGERFDFILLANNALGNYLLVAQTLETSISNYHAAEAVISYYQAPGIINPPKANGNICNSGDRCKVLNCPFRYFPSNTYRDCVLLDTLSLNDTKLSIDKLEDIEIEEKFYNFAFPGENGVTPGSVNGRQFVPPTSPILSQYSTASITPCDDTACGEDAICSCTYIDTIEKDTVYQFIISNIGAGRGWSHPIHLHGHSFYLLKIGLGTYNPSDASFLRETTDIACSGTKNFCNSETWANSTWEGNNVDGLNLDNPILKDTVIVPSGGYIVIRFKADNPGPWFFHCHIDLHNTNGMGMVIDEGRPSYLSLIPKGFPTCGNFDFDGTFENGGNGDNSYTEGNRGNPFFSKNDDMKCVFSNIYCYSYSQTCLM
ncbi:hypothetical protein FSP39_009609 [Pinctada imbricata]|uniref:L-ascorbate oxidase n=1 Tax=Pinctada imbricata TaxID=66713 RepID=A0AA88YCL4_PINIB|nr:hypothetical protein FSP39_009609 [Pinctada imbricata]